MPVIATARDDFRMRSIVRQLGRVWDGLTAVQRHGAGLVAVDMIAMTLRGGPATAPDEDGAGAILVAMMRRHIHERLTDPDLTVASLARRALLADHPWRVHTRP